jgi:hypothetical protein
MHPGSFKTIDVNIHNTTNDTLPAIRISENSDVYFRRMENASVDYEEESSVWKRNKKV